MIIYILTSVLSISGFVSEASAVENRLPNNDNTCLKELKIETAQPAPRSTPLDYQMSKLESLFLYYAEKAQGLNAVAPERAEAYVKDLLNLKAQILNVIFAVLPKVLAFPVEPTRKAELVSSIHQIVDAVGIPITVFGFEVDKKGYVTHPQLKNYPRRVIRAVASGLPNKAETKAAIGFLEGVKPDRDLPAHLHRSIGFGETKITGEAPPARAVGQIQISLSADNSIVHILDRETGARFDVPIMSMVTNAFGGKDKDMQLDFIPEYREWFVRIENLHNPTGRIGF